MYIIHIHMLASGFRAMSFLHFADFPTFYIWTLSTQICWGARTVRATAAAVEPGAARRGAWGVALRAPAP